MTDGSLTVFLHNAQQGYQVIQQVWQQAKAMLMAGHTLEFIVRKKRRSTEQNARLHAMLGDIAKQKEWAGARRDIETWKRLMTAAWLRARGEEGRGRGAARFAEVEIAPPVVCDLAVEVVRPDGRVFRFRNLRATGEHAAFIRRVASC